MDRNVNDSAHRRKRAPGNVRPDVSSVSESARGTAGSCNELVKREAELPAVREEVMPGRKKTEYERIKTSPDRILIVIIFMLVCMGSLMVFSASYPYAVSQNLGSYYYLKRQVVFAALGFVTMTIASKIPYDFYKKVAWIAYAIAAALLVLVLVMGVSEGEAQRWLVIPGTGISMQPSEIMKVALILVMARYVSINAEYMMQKTSGKLQFLYGTVYPTFILFPTCALVLLEKHLSGTAIIFMIGCIILFIGGANLGMLIGTYLPVGLIGGGLFLYFNSYAWKRVMTFFDENANALDEDWQTTQGLLAIGSGGLFGLGLGESRQKYGYVSQPQNDFIFTILCEELGFIGALFVIALFVALLWRGFTVARRAPDVFSSLVAYGIMSHVTIQAVLNIMVVTDSFFNTGVSLPFFSYGGSSLVMLMTEMGIVLSISRHSRQKKA